MVSTTRTALGRLWLSSRQRRRQLAAFLACASAVGLAVRLKQHLRCSPAELTFDERSAVLGRLLPRLHALQRGYGAPPLLPTGLLQSAMAEIYAPPLADTPYERQTIRLQELDFSADATRKTDCCPVHVPAGVVSVDWLHGNCSENAPICILVPGLTGSSSSGYIRRTAVALSRAGVRVACYSPRGRGDNPLETPFLYSAGYTEDLRRVVLLVQQRFPSAPLTAVGFSLGSNVLAKFVGEEGDRCAFLGAMSVACPLDCISMSNNLLHTRMGKILDKILVGGVHRARAEFGDVFARDDIDQDVVAEAQTMAAFDDAAIAPMFGYRCASDYYRGASASNQLKNVRVPLLFLSASNDPIAPAHLVRRDNFHGGSAKHCSTADPLPLMLAVTAEGGHSMTWPQGLRAEGAWVLEVITDFVLGVVACGGPAPRL